MTETGDPSTTRSSSASARTNWLGWLLLVLAALVLVFYVLKPGESPKNQLEQRARGSSREPFPDTDPALFPGQATGERDRLRAAPRLDQ